MAKLALITSSLLLLLALSSAAPAEKASVQVRQVEQPAAPVEAEAKDDLVAEKDDLKPAASHYGGWGYGGYGGFGGFGSYYPYWSSTYWGYPGFGYGYGGWPYYGGYGYGGYWW